MTLADHLDLRNMPLATTPAGKDFVMKALHPSEHTIRAARAPGGNEPSVAIAMDMVETIPLGAEPVSTEIIVGANPIVPAYVKVTSGPTGGRQYSKLSFINAAFGGTMVDTTGANGRIALLNAANNFARNVSKWRITSQSITAEIVAPALADQGSVYACQTSITPMTLSPAYVETGDGSTVHAYQDCWVYPGFWPEISEMILGTSAYTSAAKEGVYLPLKHPKIKFVDAKDTMWFFNYPAKYSDVLPVEGDYVATGNADYPFAFAHRPPATTTRPVPLRLQKYMHNNFGIVHFTGYAANISLRIRVRQVVEVVVPPSTQYAPLLELALPPDELSYKMYYEISARMKDGYPASYNDLGKLRDFILKVGKKIVPFVDPVLSAVSTVMPAAAPVAAAVRAGASKAGKLLQASQDRARERAAAQKAQRKG